ncbi:hypothetical protein OPV22_017758 [Ensete ventricosum]|uniref:Uncharacterized protein n=1 Tax=Ensete ventricosum TaxID=4639 RepID=A0AAV8QX31_ENSVE|nr:hypothetical protein OPV22_017758 [Ensete ventricosum]
MMELQSSVVAASALLSAANELFPVQYPACRATLSSCELVNKEKLLDCSSAMGDADAAATDGCDDLATTLGNETPAGSFNNGPKERKRRNSIIRSIKYTDQVTDVIELVRSKPISTPVESRPIFLGAPLVGFVSSNNVSRSGAPFLGIPREIAVAQAGDLFDDMLQRRLSSVMTCYAILGTEETCLGGCFRYYNDKR